MIFITYLSWHYTSGLSALFKAVIELTEAIYRSFSVSYLLRTIFYPWHRYAEPYKRGFYISEFLWTLSGNLISRVLGAVVRILTIGIGILLSFSSVVIGASLAVIWVFLPLIIPVMFSIGLLLLIP